MVWNIQWSTSCAGSRETKWNSRKATAIIPLHLDFRGRCHSWRRKFLWFVHFFGSQCCVHWLLHEGPMPSPPSRVGHLTNPLHVSPVCNFRTFVRKKKKQWPASFATLSKLNCGPLIDVPKVFSIRRIHLTVSPCYTTTKSLHLFYYNPLYGAETKTMGWKKKFLLFCHTNTHAHLAYLYKHYTVIGEICDCFIRIASYPECLYLHAIILW